MFRSRLIGFTYRISASFTPPLGGCSGLVARRLLDLDDCARQLRDALTNLREWHRSEYQSNQTIDEAADAALTRAAHILGGLDESNDRS